MLTGQEVPRIRWKRGVSLVNGYLGDAIGRLYVERWFSAAAKKRAELLTIPYAPPQYRANGAVGNIQAFYDAFAVKPGDRLYREPAARVTIW